MGRKVYPLRDRPGWTWSKYKAACRACDFEYETINCLGLAALHHDRTGHIVDVDIFGGVTYGEDQAEHELARHAKKVRQ